MKKLTVNLLTKNDYNILRQIVKRFTKDDMRTDELLHVVLLRLLEKNTEFNPGMFYVVTRNELSRLKRHRDVPSDDDSLFEQMIEPSYVLDGFKKLSTHCIFNKTETKAINCIVNKKQDLRDIDIKRSTLHSAVRSVIKKIREQNNIDVSLPIYIGGKNGEHKN